jgi:hypothetical protein
LIAHVSAWLRTQTNKHKRPFQEETIRGYLALGQHRCLQPVEQARPVRAADQDDRELGDLARRDQGQHHEGLRVLDEDRLLQQKAIRSY